MIADHASRYTSAQVVYGLRYLWQDLGLRPPRDPALRIDRDLKEQGEWEELDWGDVVRIIETNFGFHCDLPVWRAFIGDEIRDPVRWDAEVGPRFTYGALVDFIVEHAEAISLAPVTVLGRSCAPAGAFLGIEQLAREVQPKIAGVAPSSAIHRHLRGWRLLQFWKRLRWMTEERLPPLNEKMINAARASYAIGVLVAVGSVFGSIATHDIYYLGWGIVAWRTLFGLGKAIDDITNPLPPGVTTFRDLANLVADPA